MYGVDWQDGSWTGKDIEEGVCGLIEVVSWDVIEGCEKYHTMCVLTRALTLWM